jgi:alkylated DNA nucleotide flippase Atl1
MGTIARQGVLNAGGIANLFASQKDNIAAALPSGFVRSLGDVGLLGSVGDTARRMAAAGSETTRAAAASVARTLDDTRRSAVAEPSTNWLLWAIPALAIAALLLWLFARPTEQVAQQGVTTVQSLMVGGIDLGKQVTDSLNSLRTTLTDVTDTASAQAALPKLREATAQIDKVSGMLGQLSDAQRKVLAGLVSPMMSTLNQLFDKVLAIPGVTEVIKPTIDTLKAKLATLTA